MKVENGKLFFEESEHDAMVQFEKLLIERDGCEELLSALIEKLAHVRRCRREAWRFIKEKARELGFAKDGDELVYTFLDRSFRIEQSALANWKPTSVDE